MKIAMILPSLANTGPGIVVCELCKELVAQGHDCKVFYFDDKIELEMPCSVSRIGFWNRINFEDWDVVHSHMLRPDLYVWIHLFFRKKKVVLVSTLHNPISYKAFRTGYNRIFSLLGSLLWKIALTVFHHVVVLNPYTYSMIKGVNRKKLHVIFNGKNIVPSAVGCDKNDVENVSKLKEKFVIIGTISGINKRKGLEQLVKALTFLPNYALVAVGDGPELNFLKALAVQIGVSNRCYWTGYKINAEDYQSLFDIFVMCSRSEGFPLALIEAAGYGKPTVLSDIPILKSIISSNEVVFYSLGNITSLAESIQKVYRERVKYSRAIYLYYSRNLKADVMASRYLDLYKGKKVNCIS